MSVTPQVLAHQADAPEPSPEFLAREARGEITPTEASRYRAFLKRVVAEFLTHRIVVNNPFTRWFAQGQMSDDELRHFTVQFSVFSNQFLIAQLKKMLASDSIESMRGAKEILANEIGAVFRSSKARGSDVQRTDAGEAADPELVGIEGSVDGGRFWFKAAHFEWLVDFAQPLGLRFEDLGKRKHGTPSTLHFCDRLIEVYGSEDPNIGAGAGFAIENWAAAGFWQELEDGLKLVRAERHPKLQLGFWTWHNRIEAQHAGHTISDLEAAFFAPQFEEEKFLTGGRAMLEALSVFWRGLDADRVYSASA